MKLPSPGEISLQTLDVFKNNSGYVDVLVTEGARAAYVAVAKALRENATVNAGIDGMFMYNFALNVSANAIEQAAAAKEEPSIESVSGSVDFQAAGLETSFAPPIDTERWIDDTAHALAMKLGYAYKEGWAKELIANNLRERLPLILGRGK